MTPTGTDLIQNASQTKTATGKHDDLTASIIGVFYDVYNELGGGFVELIYREAMRIALTQAGFAVCTETPVPVHFRGTLVGNFRADLIVSDSVLLELKACDTLIREHEMQTLNYLKATTFEVALLMNFGPAPKFKRLVMDNHIKKNRFKSVSSVSGCSSELEASL
jgi:GxxExxY protein